MAMCRLNRTQVEVGVDKRAIVNIIARYPGPHDVFRELIQNADDAESTTIELHFETGSLPARKVRDMKVHKWIIKNKGSFQDAGWEMLGEIAAGNKDATKVGAFGVGFYSVLSKSDRPFVKSGGKSLQFCLPEGGKLWMQEASGEEDDGWTSVELELNEQEPLPALDELARFLISSVALLTHVHTISVYLDQEELLHIHKELSDELVHMPIPVHLVRISPKQALKVVAVSRTVQTVTIDAKEWAFPSPHSTPPPPPDHLDGALFAPDTHAAQHNPTSTTTTQDNVREEITNDLYTATTSVILSPDSELRKGVESYFKSLPSKFETKGIYFNYEQHQSFARKMESPISRSHLFKGIVPENNSGRLFIGQSTNQTTGIGLHFASHYLPTMERGAIDLATGQIAAWNKEVLWASGFLARMIYEEDMRFAESKGGKAKEFGLETMKRFSFGTTAPHSEVSQILQDAFFSCCVMESQDGSKPPFPVVSDTGICSASHLQFRITNKHLSFLKSYRVFHPHVDLDQCSEIIRRYNIPPFKLLDIENEFATGVTKESLLLFFRWFKDTKAITNENTKTVAREFCERITSRSVLRTSEGADIPLNTIRYFTSFPIDDDLSHPNSIYIDISEWSTLTDAFGWSPLSLLGWLKYASPKASEIAKNEDPDVGRRLWQVIIQFALRPELWTQMKRNETSTLVKGIRCIPSQKGFSLPGESYMKESICPEIPVARVENFLGISGHQNVTSARIHVCKVLVLLGVRDEVGWTDLISALENWASEESNVRILQHLRTQGFTESQQNDLRKKKVFYSQGHGPSCAAELHSPNDDICKLGLPILALPPDSVTMHSDPDSNSTDSIFSSSMDLNQVLASLGIMSYPSLQTIIQKASSHDERIGETALRYFLDHFDEHYEDYNADEFAEVAFIPTKGGPESRACLNEVFQSPNWGGKLKFKQASEKLQPLDLLKLGIKDSPTIDTIVKCFQNPSATLPNHETAKHWFEHLSLHGGFPFSDLRDRLSTIAFVPVKNCRSSSPEAATPKYCSPKECFIGSLDSNQHHRDIFTFVDFGEQGNLFLRSCCARDLPDAADVACKMAEDPQKYLDTLEMDTNKLYTEDLRMIASQFDSISEETKGKMRHSPMFLGFRQQVSILLPASRVVIGDWESRDFGSYVFLAPEEEIIKKMYHEMGSQYLGAYVRCNVKCSGPRDRCDPAIARDQIIRGVNYFLSRQDQRKITKVSYNGEGVMVNFGVKVCKSLKVAKTFTRRPGVLPDDVRLPPAKASAVRAALDPDSSTLWLVECVNKQTHMHNDVAIALCSGLLNTFSRQDVMLLAALIALDETEFRLMYPNQDKYYIVPDAPVQEKLESKRRNLENSFEPQWRIPSPDAHRQRVRQPEVSQEQPTQHISAAEDDVQNAVNKCSSNPDQVKGHDFSSCCRQYHTDFKKGNGHCKERHKVRFIEQESSEGQLRLFLADDTSCPDLPSLRDALTKFSELITDLAKAFGLPDTASCCIFWEDTDDLMAFNRDKFIFFNLFHYNKFYFERNAEEKDEVADWFLMMAHEIAHNLIQDHDEYHGSLTSKLVLTYLPALQKRFPLLAKVTPAESIPK